MRHPEGLFGWIDLGTTDVEAARAFYQGLFGWESTDMATPLGPAYTTFTMDGQIVAGMGPRTPNDAASGDLSTWNSYVLVEDLDAVLKRAETAGGSVIMPAMDVMTQGRLAMITDPTGAAVGLWQPMDHQGADLFNSPGALTWNELQTRDVGAAKDFYTEVFGWRWTPMAGPVEYFVGYIDAKPGEDKSNNGLLSLPSTVSDDISNFWAVYFAVADCEATLAEVEQLGGEAFMPATDMGPGKFGGLTDPTGARFFVASYPAQ